MIRIAHLADTHLGYRQYMLLEREKDFYEAFNQAIELAIQERADLIVHSGDIFDSPHTSNQALRVFKDALLKINKKARFFAVLGDHDRSRKHDYPAPQLFDFLGVRVMGVHDLEHQVLNIHGDELLVVGLSNFKGIYAKTLPEKFEQADRLALQYRNAIFIGHEGISTFLPPEQYEVAIDTLPKNFQYLAFGHVHNRVLEEYGRGYLAYAGSTELHSADEIETFVKNGKGINLVDIDHEGVSVQFLNIDTIRPQLLLYTTMNTWEEKLKTLLSQNFNKLPIVHMRLSGELSSAYIHSKITEKFKHMMLDYRLKVDSKKTLQKSISTIDLKNAFIEYFNDESLGTFAYELFELLKSADKNVENYILTYLEQWSDKTS